MGWLFLAFAILFEVIGTTLLKKTDGNLLSLLGGVMMVSYAVSFVFLAYAIKCNIELGVGYAVWSGVGTAMIVLIGIFIFNESASVVKFLCIGLIIVGVIGLKLDQPERQPDDRHSSSDLGCGNHPKDSSEA